MYGIEWKEISGVAARGTYAFIYFRLLYHAFRFAGNFNFLGARMPTLASALSEYIAHQWVRGDAKMRERTEGP